MTNDLTCGWQPGDRVNWYPQADRGYGRIGKRVPGVVARVGQHHIRIAVSLARLASGKPAVELRWVRPDSLTDRNRNLVLDEQLNATAESAEKACRELMREMEARDGE